MNNKGFQSSHSPVQTKIGDQKLPCNHDESDRGYSSAVSPLKDLLKKLLGFCSVGGAMTLLSMLMIAVTNEFFHWHPQVSYIFAYLTTLILSYLLNIRYVFHSHYSWKGLGAYCLTYISSMILGSVLLWFLMRIFPNVNNTLLSYCLLPATTLWNFFFTKKITASSRR